STQRLEEETPQPSGTINDTTSSDHFGEIERTPLQLNLYVTRHQDFASLYELEGFALEHSRKLKNETNDGSSTSNATGSYRRTDIVVNSRNFVERENDRNNGACRRYDGDRDHGDSDTDDIEIGGDYDDYHHTPDDGELVVHFGSGKPSSPSSSVSSNGDSTTRLDEINDELNFVRSYCNERLFSLFGDSAYEHIVSKKCTTYRPSYLTAYVADDLNRLREKDPYVCLNYVLLKEYLAMHGVPLTALNDELI
ncbi:hypothetical protein KPH14_013078, partial [Odynerus spinipes]